VDVLDDYDRDRFLGHDIHHPESAQENTGAVDLATRVVCD
jgi:hypothetical protein